MAKLGWEDLLEFGLTVTSAVGASRWLQGEPGQKIKEGFDALKATINAREQLRVATWSYINTKLDMEYSAPLAKIHRDAQVKPDLLRANRIEEVYILVYITFNNEELGPKDEREQAREEAFQELAKAAAQDDPTGFDVIMASYERQGLMVYLRIAKQLGIDAWNYLGAPFTAIAEAIGGEGAVEKLKMYFQNPERWGPDLWHYRNTSPFHQSARRWMDEQAENLRLRNEESKARVEAMRGSTPMSPDSTGRLARIKRGAAAMPPFAWPFIITGVVILLSILIGYTQR